MADCIDLLEMERTSKKLQMNFNEWKEIIVLLNAIITWKKNWFPIIIIFCVTSSYLYVWSLVNCSTLNIIWMTGFCFTLLDCFLCGPFQRILPPNYWDQDKEHAYAAICESVADYFVTFKLYVERFFKLRQTNTNLFHSVLLVSFFRLYIGTFDNLFVSYITVLVIILFKTRSRYIEEYLQSYLHLI